MKPIKIICENDVPHSQQCLAVSFFIERYDHLCGFVRGDKEPAPTELKEPVYDKMIFIGEPTVFYVSCRETKSMWIFNIKIAYDKASHDNAIEQENERHIKKRKKAWKYL